MDLAGRNVTLMGLGRHGGGVAAARYASQQGARVTVTDLLSAADLAESIEELADCRIAAWRLGGHREEDFRLADVIVVSSAVPLDHPLLAIARRAGGRITSETELFLRGCRASLIGVTGSNGKSTTAAMIAAILRADSRRCELGGNIGRSLLPELGRLCPGDWGVVELSSFQLAHLSPGTPLPRVAVVTGCTPNHLDWHKDWSHYQAAKQRLVTEQPAGGAAVFHEDDELSSWYTVARGRVHVACGDDALPCLRVAGPMNRHNAQLAAAAARAVGASEEAIAHGLAGFSGLPHRLELIARFGGRCFYDDSLATTTESVIAALTALREPVWLLAGGKDKGVELTALCQAVARLARGGCFYGATRDRLLQGVRHAWSTTPAASRATAASGPADAATKASPARAAAGRSFEVPHNDRFSACEHLEDALHWCWERSRRGEVILLSPGCASYDQFHDYRHRADVFRKAAAALGR